MYSSLKNHSSNLQYCERFYNNAYQYYNDYEKPEDYEDDLSKLFFKCKRKTIATLWCYGNPSHQPYPEVRAIRGVDKKMISLNGMSIDCMDMESQSMSDDRKITMEDLLSGLVEIYHQNNFSDFKNDLEENKNKHKIVYFPQQKILKTKASSQRNKSYNLQLDFIQHLMQSFNKKVIEIKKLIDQDQVAVEDAQYFGNQLAFEFLNKYELQSLLKNKDEGSKIISIYNLFKTMIQNVLDQMCDSQSWSHLILYIPKLPVLNYLFNPLVSGIYTFLRKEQSLSKSDFHKNEQAERQLPKIVLINLDGRQTPQNIRTITQCSPIGLMYITIYNESLHHQQIEDEQDQVSQMISKLLIKQIDIANKKATQDKRNKGKNYTEVPKVFAFPLNSKYVKSLMKQKHGLLDNINCTLGGTSEDIMFLFQNVLFEQIRNFSPNIVVVNYNGALHINEQHFSRIIRTLTIISDHRIILFPNLCNLFQTQEQASIRMPEPQILQPEVGYIEEQTLLRVKSYMQKYHQIDLNQIDIHNFFNNLLMFLKISSGTYSFEERHHPNSAVFQKYQSGLKYEYLERLAELVQFKYYGRFVSKHLNGNSLMRLMKKERKQIIQKNQDNAPLYKEIIDEAIQEMWGESESVPKAIQYKLKKISRSFDDNEEKLEGYLELKKDRLLIQTIKSQKIKKAYYVKPSTRENQPDSLYVYTFRTNSEQRENIFLQNYSQIIFQQQGDKILNVFAINIRDDNDRLQMMFGQTKINGYQVYLTPIVQDFQVLSTRMHSLNLDQQDTEHLQYINYSHTFYQNHLYLFWPYQWDIKLEAQSLLVGLEYLPKVVNRMVKISTEIREGKLKVVSMPIVYQAKTDFIPRLQVGSWAESYSKIFVFGGICGNQNDFEIIDSGVYIISIHNSEFWVQAVPKSINIIKIRPKINYVVDQVNDYTLAISGGHGRQFTNFFNIFSYHAYEFNIKTLEIVSKKTTRKVIQLPKPMYTRKEGRFDMAKDKGVASNAVKIQQRVSNQPKYKFILCRKGFYSQKNSEKCSAITFLDDDYTTTIYNKQNSFNHIFNSNRIFQNIYSQRYCSPEIYVWDKSKDLIRIQILLQVSKHVNQYAMKEYIFPNEDSLIGFCVHSSNQKIYLLAKSPIYTRDVYIMYEGSLKNNEVIASEKQLRMKIFFEFRASIHKLQGKAVYSQDHRLIICGGSLNNYGVREDYLLQRVKGKYKLKTIKICFPAKPFAVQIPNPYIMQTLDDGFLAYSVCLNQNQKWVIKVQQFTLGVSKRTIKSSQINLNTICESHIYKISPCHMKLSFLNVSRYSRFSFEFLRGKMHALLIEMNKLEEQIDLNQLQQQLKSKVIMLVLKHSHQVIESKIPYIYDMLKKFINYIIKEKSDNIFYIEKSMIAWELVLIIVNYKIQSCYFESFSIEDRKKMERLDLYRFILEDKTRPLTKYVAISELGTSKLRFFQIKTRKPIVSNIVSNTSAEEQYGVHLSQKNCNEIYFDQLDNYQKEIQMQRNGRWPDTEQNVYTIQTETFWSNPVHPMSSQK